MSVCVGFDSVWDAGLWLVIGMSFFWIQQLCGILLQREQGIDVKEVVGDNQYLDYNGKCRFDVMGKNFIFGFNFFILMKLCNFFSN